MSTISSEEIISILKEKIENYDAMCQEQETGKVISVGDGIATIYGIDHAMYGEIVTFENGEKGMVQDIRQDTIGCILFGKDTGIKEGTRVVRTKKKAGIPVGEGFVGRVINALGEPIEDLKLITCHLGNGCSISAIDHGVAVDTSMGLTPLDGLMMGTRCGAIDPAIVPFVMEHEGLTAGEMNDLMNKKSGLLGISGISNDLRSVRDASEQGHERAMLAYDMYSNSVKKYIGQYIAVMGGVDAIVLTAGVGENCEKMRRMIFAGLQPLGMILDEEKNRQRGFEREISTESSPVKIIIIPTNEEYMIARDTYEILHEKVDVPLV